LWTTPVPNETLYCILSSIVRTFFCKIHSQVLSEHYSLYIEAEEFNGKNLGVHYCAMHTILDKIQ